MKCQCQIIAVFTEPKLESIYRNLKRVCYVSFTGALSSWMRFNEYHLPGHTRKEASNVLTAEDCWDACLQETSFSCLSVAYAGVSKSCKLYDKQALSVYKDGAHSDEFNYYEYCADGEWYDFRKRSLTRIFFSGGTKSTATLCNMIFLVIYQYHHLATVFQLLFPLHGDRLGLVGGCVGTFASRDVKRTEVSYSFRHHKTQEQSFQ